MKAGHTRRQLDSEKSDDTLEDDMDGCLLRSKGHASGTDRENPKTYALYVLMVYGLRYITDDDGGLELRIVDCEDVCMRNNKRGCNEIAADQS